MLDIGHEAFEWYVSIGHHYHHTCAHKKLTFLIIPLVQGCWRKVTIDDSLPFLEQSTTATGGDVDTASVAGAASGTDTTIAAQVHYVPLYPRTAHPAELWPAIITKAVLKIAVLE